MFDLLAEKLQATLADVRGHGTLTEEDITRATREIRLALLEADVNFGVVKDFTARVRERCLDAEIVGGLNPGQQVVKIVHEELADLFGGESEGFAFASRPPTVVLMAGLQGSGKTTASAKLAKHLATEHGSSVALAACDLQRPAAIQQLQTMGERAGATVYAQDGATDAVGVARWALDRAKSDGKDVLIVDTAGRLHVDRDLMDELVSVRDAVKPQTVLLVVDAMTGQDAVNVAQEFAQAVAFDGVVMTKLDGDARGGAALSVKAVTGRPIVFASVGEKIDQLERFHPERMAQRVLGMGDVMSLIEKAEAQFDVDEAAELERKIRSNEFTLEDFLSQLKMVRRMGPLSSILGMMPGMGAQLKGVKVDERELDRVQAIILSMTPEERRKPELIRGSRRLRIARGSGTNVQAVNRLVKQFGQMRKVMRQVGRGKMPDIGALMRQGR